MTSNDCPHHEVVITTQDDIDNAFSIFSCTGANENLELAIRNATGTLNFTTLENAWFLNVSDSPALERAFFPELTYARKVLVDQAESLTTLSFPVAWIDNIEVTSAPSLNYFNMGINTNDTTVALNDVPLSYSSPLENVSSADSIEVPFCKGLENLGSVSHLQVAGQVDDCSLNLDNLGSVQDMNLSSIHSVRLGKQLAVGSSLSLSNCSCPGYLLNNALDISTLDMGGITTVGDSTKIANNSDYILSFKDLTTISGHLSVTNNTNCHFNFKNLREATSISMLDNIDSTLPQFTALELVGDIHLRGSIHSSDIFPALILAKGTVTVEAWNDFDCSKLQSQHSDDVIKNLDCNGTSSGTVPNEVGETSAMGLSKGAWVGIGVGIAVFVILSVSAIIWLLLYFRRLLKNTHGRSETQREDSQGAPEQTFQNEVQQLDGQGIVREKPDDHLQEMLVPPEEVPDSQIYELPSSPAVLSPNTGTVPGTAM